MVDNNSDDSSLVEVTRQDFDTRLRSADNQPFIAAGNSLQDTAKNIRSKRPRRPRRVDPSLRTENDTRDGTNQEAALKKEPSDRNAVSSFDSGQGWFRGRVGKRGHSVSFPTPRLMLIRVHDTGKLLRVSHVEQARIVQKMLPTTLRLEDIADYVVAHRSELPAFEKFEYLEEAAGSKQDAAFNEDATHVHPNVLAVQMNGLELSAEAGQDVTFNGGVFLSTGRFYFIDGWRDALEIRDNESGDIWRVDDNEQKRVYHYLRPTEVWSRKCSEHRLLVADYLAMHPDELARALAEMKETKQRLGRAIELPRTSIRKPSKAHTASEPSSWEQPEPRIQGDANLACCVDASVDGMKCDRTQDTRPRNTHPTLSTDVYQHGPPPGFSGDPVPARSRKKSRGRRPKGPKAVSRPQGDMASTRATEKASDARVETQLTRLSMENRAELPAAKKDEILQSSVKQKRRRMRSITNEQPRVTLRAYKEANETGKMAASTDFAAMTRMASKDKSDDPATVNRGGLEYVGPAKKKADREQSPPRKKARVQEQVFQAPSPKRMSLADLAAYLAKERAQRARGIALRSGEKGSLPSHKAGETAAVTLTPGQGTIVFKYQQANAEAALSATRRQEMARNQASLPSKSEGIVREKLLTPLPTQDVNLPTRATPRTMPTLPSPIQTTSLIAERPQATMFPLSSPLPSVGLTTVSSHPMMRKIPSSAGSGVFASGGCPVMINQTPSPFSLAGLLPVASLPILSVSQARTMDDLSRDIRRHASEVRGWMNNGGPWKTPIELGFDHMVMLRDHEILAVMMALEFEKVDEVNARLMKMSDELHDSTVVLYERTKMFLGET